MKRYRLIAAVSIVVFSAAAWAQTPPAHPREPVLLTLLRMRMAARRIANPTLPAARPRDVTRPVITGGKIVTTTISTDRPPAAPAILLRYDTNGVGLRSIVVGMVSPSGKQSLLLGSETVPGERHDAGTMVLQQPLGFSGSGAGALFPGQGAVSFYAEPGTWSVSYISIDDQAGDATLYDAADLAKLLQVSTFNVSNPNLPDLKPPKTLSGHVLTRSVSLGSSVPYYKAEVTASDEASGIDYVGSVLQPPPGSGSEPIFALSNLASPLASGRIGIYSDMTRKPVGIWTIFSYFACDVASNCFEIDSPDQVKALFGTNSFEVAP